MRTAIIVTVKLEMDTIDRLAIKGVSDEEAKPYIITTLLAALKKIRSVPLFGKASIVSVDIVRSKEASATQLKGGK